ncbi:hypothetical protein BH23CHL5_BH23CHL5_22950 [soil metagenome]
MNKQDAPRTQEQCSGTTKAGQRCRAKALPGSAFCISHDPSRVVEMAEWRRAGGRAKSNRARAKKALPADLMTNEQLHAYLGLVFGRVIVGQIEPGVATAAASVARTMAELSRATELEQRIVALETERERRRA